MEYIMVWVEEEEKWYYFINDFEESIFPNGYVDYYIEVEDGIIKSDSWGQINVGRKFRECYSEKLWQTNWDSTHSEYNWIRYNQETNKYDVVSLWETLPMFKGDPYLINVDQHQIEAESSEEAYEIAIEEDNREIDSFEAHAEVEVYLKEKFGIKVILPRKIDFT